jgi:hypothetical protein
MTDRQGSIVIGLMRQRLINKEVTRRGTHDVDDADIGDARFAQTTDQTLTGARRGHADAVNVDIAVSHSLSFLSGGRQVRTPSASRPEW